MKSGKCTGSGREGGGEGGELEGAGRLKSLYNEKTAIKEIVFTPPSVKHRISTERLYLN